jgi:hypothetical protein
MTGFRHASEKGYAKAVTIDVDLQHTPEQIPRFLEKLDRHTVVLGSRYVRIDGYLEAPFTRLLINRYMTTVVNTLFSMTITDAFCGFRGYRTAFFRKARLREGGYGIALEILAEIARTGTRFTEIPVEVIYTGAKRMFLDGLDDPRKRFGYYMDVIMRHAQESPATRGDKR